MPFDTSALLRTHPAAAGLTLALLVALGVGLTTVPRLLHAQASATPPAKEGKASMTVTLQAPKPMNWASAIAANGSIAPWQELSVAAQAQGLRLTALRADVGQTVAKGQVLAVLDDATLRAEKVQLQAQLAEAQAVAAEASAHAERARTLIHSGALSEQQLTQLATAATTAHARVASVQAALALQHLRIQQAQVLAPEAGIVAQRSAVLGAVVPVGAELFRLIRQGRLEWVAEVSASDLSAIALGHSVTVRAPNGKDLIGKVRLIAPTVDPQSRNAKVYVELPASDTLKAGMFASGTLQTGASTGWGVPLSAVVYRDGFAYVFAMNGADRVQRLKVQTGQRQGDWVEVVAGLGEQPAQRALVVSGTGFLNDGDKVKVVKP
jgi:RND family efflux transporter MFP subunit